MARRACKARAVGAGNPAPGIRHAAGFPAPARFEVVREASRAPMPRKLCRVNGLRGFGLLPKVYLAVDK
jgi:hypothetical protein